MKRSTEVIAGLMTAVVLQTVIGKISPSLLLVFNPFSWAVLYFGLTRREIFGAIMGTGCGLLQDSLSLGVFGVSGLTKTLLGFATGYISRKINVVSSGRTFVFVLIMAAAELALWKFLVHFLFGEKWATGGGLLFLQPLAAAAAVTGLYQLKRKSGAEVP
ncbi:MAG: rod shape-determining protein MreD [Candidatus Aminicenantes bacterium]|nr:rod shape-determining protein MreD [Candidatus Aminicenantes bacterium]